MKIDVLFYMVGNRAFVERNDAIEYSIKSEIPIKFYCNDHFWKKQDWINPTQETLDSIYLRRAEQLRNEYDYIILCYSGGADSWNILKTFDRGNIHIDEIVSWHSYSITNNKTSKENSEVFRVAVPTVENYLKNHPHTKFNLMDYKEPLIRMLSGANADTLFNSTATIGSPIRFGTWIYYLPEYLDIINSGKKIAILWGNDKTTVTYIKDFGVYKFWFNDLNFDYQRKNKLFKCDNVRDENFYWTINMPELLIKQCHIIKGAIDNFPTDYVDKYYIDTKMKKKTHVKNKNGNLISLPIVNSILYGWNPNTFTEGKPGGDHLLTELDYWVKDLLNEDIVRRWATIASRHVNDVMKIYKRELNKEDRLGNILLSQKYTV